MSQHEFDELLQKYLVGGCDPAEEKLIQDWYQGLATQLPPPIDAQEKEAIRQRIWQKLRANTTKKGHKIPQSLAPFWYPAAACLALLLLTGVWRYWSVQSIKTIPATRLVPTQGSIQLRNISTKPQLVTLEDGSRITLQPGSVVSYPAHFGQLNRTVFLMGEAFFNVKRDPTKPFMVHTGELITEVLGTSFTVKASDGAAAIEVSVTTGRVSVYRAADRASRSSKEVILKPNERLTYRPTSRQLIPSLVTHPVRVIPPSQPVNLLFDGTPLPDVLASIQAVYGIDIFLESDALNACVLNADLNDLPLYDQLDLVCRSVDALYEVRGTSIFIKTTGPGCQ